ncbi:DOPA 4,5-dioxygenase [Tistlia consotensis]|uniref:DOPA 4,5-dioxygenase n=1 Tax=Tistlia consotensis USBA 355 TaxID=560819 RepID=A0A1Y6C9C2_9PROT|nr:DOPA 4,5-dioxygenase family protein [Tistlia consotensis]SMF51480.1 DOPA 4,5-dioxygenase [Tistlia consotensis USBA 355]SNR84223.1 DOPA 4,5-dioxygenase [Tistlia consotensis]
MKLDPEAIGEFHAHVYYDEASRPRAAALREAIVGRFGEAVRMGRWRDQPVGPHPQAMYQVVFPAALFGEIVPWLMASRDGLDVLVHPSSGLSDLLDHSAGAIWLGRSLSLDLSAFKREAAAD